MTRDLSQFKGRRDDARESAEQERAEEAMHIRHLLADVSGRWLLAWIIERGDLFPAGKPEFNNRDYFALGKRKLAGEVAELIKNHGDPKDIAQIIFGKEV